VLDEQLLPQGVGLVTDGFGDYVTSLLKDLDVLRGSNVTQIDYGNTGIGLRLVTGESLSADRVISTIPLGVLKKRKIVFVPALPAAHLASIDHLGMGLQDVLWLRFDEKLWSTDASLWAVLDDSATYPLWLNLEPATGYPILVALTGGAPAKKIEKLSDDEAVTRAVDSISAYFDLAPSTASPTPAPSSTPGS
jgi:monoamine oxidase